MDYSLETPRQDVSCCIRLPCDVLTIPQWMTLGQLAERYGQSVMDITKRQGVQLRWIQIKDVPAIFSALSRVDMSPLQTGFDNVRNVMSCPMAGINLDQVLNVV
ncbi:hypothetical protein [Sulfoacidibacillus ferrooxidans]|uniref:hypothetical protein n=1 Tax=Sulfoacidibacillus ferrooxidans TaxID=2005001 RepID=UPI00235181D2|nr:hypothetical protein [Sulfoacidibacillus ferrooxidans]